MGRLTAEFSAAFSRDLKKKAKRRKWDLAELERLIDLVIENTPESMEVLKRCHNMHRLEGAADPFQREPPPFQASLFGFFWPLRSAMERGPLCFFGRHACRLHAGRVGRVDGSVGKVGVSARPKAGAQPAAARNLKRKPSTQASRLSPRPASTLAPNIHLFVKK